MTNNKYIYCGNCEHFYDLEEFDELYEEPYTGYCSKLDKVIKVDRKICDKWEKEEIW